MPMSKKYLKSTAALILIFLVLWIIGTFFIPSESVTYYVEGEALTVLHTSSAAFQTEVDYSYTIQLSEIVSYDLIELEPDAIQSEGTDAAPRYGFLQVSGYGLCQVCLHSKPDRAVLIQTENGEQFLMSFEDNDNTQGFFEGLNKLMEKLYGEEG